MKIIGISLALLCCLVYGTWGQATPLQAPVPRVNNLPLPHLIIYGGTFDPPHDGHLLCTKLAAARFPQAEVLVCPSYAPLLDPTIMLKKTTMLDFNTRLQLARAIFQGERLSVSDLEAHLPQPTATINTLQFLQKKRPKKRLALLIGQDQFASLHTWVQAQDIVACCDIIVARRPNAPALDSSAQTLSQMLDVPLAWDAEQQRYVSTTFSVYLLEEELLDISSTALRKGYQQGQELQDVPAAVANFFNHKEHKPSD